MEKWNDVQKNLTTALTKTGSKLAVELPDGSALDIDDSEWPLIASAAPVCTDASDNTTCRLKVRGKEKCGFIVLVATERQGTRRREGEIVSADGHNLVPALYHLQSRFGLPDTSLMQCLEQLFQKHVFTST